MSWSRDYAVPVAVLAVESVAPREAPQPIPNLQDTSEALLTEDQNYTGFNICASTDDGQTTNIQRKTNVLRGASPRLTQGQTTEKTTREKFENFGIF